jgi:hypothetical protein
MTPNAPTLRTDERIIAKFNSDRGTYWRAHGIMALIWAVATAAVIWLTGQENVAVGAFGALAAITVRAVYLYSEQMAVTWTLTDIRLIGPAERQVMLLDLTSVRRLFSDVQLITRGGDKYLMKFQPNTDAVMAQITTAKDLRARGQHD